MARVEISSMPWGTLLARSGQAQGGLSATIKNLDGSNATTWSAVTGGSSSTSSVTSDANGNLPGFIEGGQYTLDVTALGVTGRRVEAVSGSVESGIVQRSINVKDAPYSATGNGTTDDSTAIQAAIDAAAASTTGARVYLPPGTYIIGTALSLPGGVSGKGGVLQGAGAQTTTLKLKNSANTDIVRTAGAYWKITDLAFDGNKANNSSGNCIKIAFPRAWVTDCYIANAKEHGILNEGTVSQQAHAVLYNNLYIFGCGGTGLYVKGVYAPDAQGSNIWVGSCTSHGLFVESAVSSIWSNLHPWGNGGAGMKVTGGHTTITGIYSETNTGSGVHFATGANGSTLTNFWIWANTEHGIFLEDITSPADITIGDGMIQDMVGYGIVGQNSSYVQVHSVKSRDTQGVKTQGYAINTNGTSDRWIITDNKWLGSEHRLSSKLLVGTNNIYERNIEGLDTWRRAVTATGSIFSTDPRLISVTDTSAARTITLPAISAVPAGTEFTIKDETGGAGTNNITVQRAGSDTIDGQIAKIINTAYGEIRVYSTGTAWFTRGRKDLATPWMPGIAESGAGRDVPVGNLTSAGLGLTSGKLFLVGGGKAVLPAGRQVTNLSFVTGTTGVTTPTNQWFCIVRQSDLAVLAKTADDTSTAWALGTIKTLALSSPYTPDVDTPVYFGLVVVAAGMPDLRGWGTVGVLTALAPILAGNSTASLTNPASLGGTAGAITSNGNVPYAYAS